MYCLFHLKKVCSVPESAGQLLFISKKSFLSITNSRKANTFKPRKITILHRIQKKIVRGVLLLRNTAPVIISLKRITLQCHYGAVIKKCWTRNYYRRGPNYTSASGTGARNNSLYIPNCAKVISRFIPLGSGMISRLRWQTRNLS